MPQRGAPSDSGLLLGSSHRLLAWEPRVPPRAGAGPERHAVLRPEGTSWRCCKSANARGWTCLSRPRPEVGFFFSFFPISAPPTSRAVSASVRPLPKLGGVYYLTNSSSDLPWSLEVALRRRAFRERKGLPAGLRVPGELQGGLRGRRGWCVVTPTGVLLWVC